MKQIKNLSVLWLVKENKTNILQNIKEMVLGRVPQSAGGQ